jgi:hypothetical protein
MKISRKLAVLGLLTAAVALTACEKPADVASRNLSTAADNYQVKRRVIVVNGITDNILFEVIGFCALGNNDPVHMMSMTCKDATGIKKHFFRITDNSPVLVSDVDGTDVSTFHTVINVRPQTLIPDFDFQGDASELLQNRN